MTAKEDVGLMQAFSRRSPTRGRRRVEDGGRGIPHLFAGGEGLAVDVGSGSSEGSAVGDCVLGVGGAVGASFHRSGGAVGGGGGAAVAVEGGGSSLQIRGIGSTSYFQ